MPNLELRDNDDLTAAYLKGVHDERDRILQGAPEDREIDESWDRKGFSEMLAGDKGFNACNAAWREHINKITA
jgi:hypothetical protein